MRFYGPAVLLQPGTRATKDSFDPEVSRKIQLDKSHVTAAECGKEKTEKRTSRKRKVEEEEKEGKGEESGLRRRVEMKKMEKMEKEISKKRERKGMND